MSAEESFVVVEEHGALARVVLNRPGKRNALTRSMLERLEEIFRSLSERAELRAVILTGAGREAFSAGTDISELEGLDEDGARRASERGQRVCESIELCAVPVIAALNGAAIGGGCELALGCHLRIASNSARFALPEIKLGMIPAYGGTQRLARAVGEARALALMFAGDEIKAEEALRLGLVNRVVAPEETMAEAERLAAEISKLAPLAVRACLQAVTRGARLPVADGLALEAQLFSRLFSTTDVREGTRAFLEKREPRFKGQ